MATILIVDDRPINRDFLVTLLGYRGHCLLEAADGAEALEVTRAGRPDLIISDILMPTMDGYEFVRQLRADINVAHIPVIFSTAHYLDREAKALAQQCGVAYILPKPCEPEAVLNLVDTVLGPTPAPVVSPPEEAFGREHRRLMTNQLARKAEELQTLNEKLTALLDLGQYLASECDPSRLLDAYCRGARDIIGAKWAAISILGEDQAGKDQLFVNGLDHGVIAALDAREARQGVLGDVIRERCPYRLRSVGGEPQMMRLPNQFPPVTSFLGVPMAYQAHVYGWLCLANKLGSDEFSEADERLAITLAAQVGIAHENARLFGSVRRHASELTQALLERHRVQEALQEHMRLALLRSEVGVALTHSSSLPESLQHCTEVFANLLDVAFARIWTLNPQQDMLELRASAGMYTHLDGPHSRVPVGQFKIGKIAQERRPHLTNAVIGDPQVGDQEWARHEGMVAFAGYPLLVKDKLVGVAAVFARHALTEATLEALAAVANTIALSVERLQSRDALYESELRFRQLTEHIREVFFLYESAGERLLYVSPTYEQVWGRSALALYENMQDFIEGVSPEDRPCVYASMEQLKQGEQSQVEFRIVRPDGELRWIVVRAFPFQGHTGEGYRVAGVAEDITARKQAEAEREQFREQLFQSQKLEAIGTLARGIAHDFNNLLGTILGYSELALDDAPRDSTVHSNLQEVISAGKRARDLVHQILTFSRNQAYERQRVQLQPFIQEVLRLMRASFPPSIAIHQHLDTTVGPILADPTQMHQVLMNLCTNAEYAMHLSGGVLEVQLAAVEVAGDYPNGQPPLAPGPYVRLTVQDTGPGMAPELLEHIFEPFFTTKPLGEGTGLGLSVVQGIVASHGGAITVASVLGQGTTFEVYLPGFDHMPLASVLDIATLRGAERLLFVDAEAALARWGEETLEPLGYDVVACTSAVEALKLLREAAPPFAVLVTDDALPGMSSEVLVHEVKRLCPALPIILCTNSSTTFTKDEAAALGIHASLAKPVLRQDLVGTIRQVLDRKTDIGGVDDEPHSGDRR
jgi:PAS domain S-box-containing protein